LAKLRPRGKPSARRRAINCGGGRSAGAIGRRPAKRLFDHPSQLRIVKGIEQATPVYVVGDRPPSDIAA
jgi:hypothetical protein